MNRQAIIRFRRKFFEFIGSDRYSRPSLNGIDRKLEKYLPYRNGFFIEVGANDGYTQSNTYHFERFRGWTGVLIEPFPALYSRCVRERPKSRVFNCALVANDYKDTHVEMTYANLMSLVKGAQKSTEADAFHISRARYVTPYDARVPARTLSSILDECHVGEIDLFSLDVEGYELNVLRGLDFERYKPHYMLIETRFKEEIDEYLMEYYSQVDQFSKHDSLYRRK